MQIQIKKSKTVTETQTIDVEFPYYYEDSDGDDETYHSATICKIENGKVFELTITEYYNNKNISYELSVNDFDSYYHRFFDSQYTSNEEEFTSAIDKLVYEISLINESENMQKAGYHSLSRLLDDIDKCKREIRRKADGRNLLVHKDGGNTITTPGDLFEKLWKEKSTYADKNKQATYDGFLMALDYLVVKS